MTVDEQPQAQPPEAPRAPDDPFVIKFNPPSPVYPLAKDEPGDLQVDVSRPLQAYGELQIGARVGIVSPWPEHEFLVGQVAGQPGMVVLLVGESFGELEHVKDQGWQCNGLVRQADVLQAMAALQARREGGSFTKRLTKRAAKQRK